MIKVLSVILLAAAATLQASCLVTSVFPFYTEKDLVFERALVGDWINVGEGVDRELWKFEKTGERAYRLTLIEQREATVMEVRAFKLQGQLFLDLGSIDRDIRVIPPHTLMRVSSLAPRLQMSRLDNDWLRKLLATNAGGIAHHLVRNGDKPDDMRVVLTASTVDLQKFVLEHLGTPDAWKAEIDLKRDDSPLEVRPRSPGGESDR